MDTGAGGLGAPAGGITPAPAGDMAAAPEPAEDAAAPEGEEQAAATDGVMPEEESEAAGKNEAFATAESETDAAATDEQATAETDAAAGEEMTAETDAAGAEETTTADAGTDTAATTETTTAETETDAAATTDTATADAGTDAATEATTTSQAETDAETTETETETVQVQPVPAEGSTEQAGAAFDAESGFVAFSADQVRASTLMGQEIFGPGDESIGEVSDLVVQQDGETRAALVDVGGFLGVGEKEVAIPFDQIEVQPAQEGGEPRLSIAMTQEELEQLPAWEDPAEMAAADEAAQPAGTEGAATIEEPADAGQATETAEADAAATGQQMAEIGSQDLSAENLIGQAIYSPEEETVGEVGDVIFDQSGGIEAVVVDVGGFLGMGEKPVAIQFDALNVQKDEAGDLRLMVNATQEQLENAPTYEVEEQTAQ
jgi:sporulation protein YlmC with PRC-barrel domain